MKIRSALFVIAACLGIVQLHAAPYTGWNSDYTGSELGTVALWKFDAATGAGTNSYTGTDYSKPSMIFFGGATGGTVTGKFGQALSTGTNADGRSATATGTGDVFPSGSAISIDFWYQAALGTDTTGYFFDKLYNTNSGIRLFMNNGALMLTVGNGTATTSVTSSAITLDTTTWNNFAVTYQNIDGDGHLKIFMNGNLLASTVADNFGDLAAGVRVWTIGNRSASSYSQMQGYYDNFRVASIAYDYAPVPEPHIAGLLIVSGVAGLVWRRKRHTSN